MESQPQNPEYRDNSKTFTDVILSDGYINMSYFNHLLSVLVSRHNMIKILAFDRTVIKIYL